LGEKAVGRYDLIIRKNDLSAHNQNSEKIAGGNITKRTNAVRIRPNSGEKDS
jgi:hypothetical protein